MPRNTRSNLKMVQMNMRKKMAWGKKNINEVYQCISRHASGPFHECHRKPPWVMKAVMREKSMTYVFKSTRFFLLQMATMKTTRQVKKHVISIDDMASM